MYHADYFSLKIRHCGFYSSILLVFDAWCFHIRKFQLKERKNLVFRLPVQLIDQLFLIFLLRGC